MSYFWNGDHFQTTATPPSPGIDAVQMRNSSSNPNLIQYANDHTNRPRSMPDHVIVSSAHEQHINEIKLREDFCTKADKGQCQLTCLQVSWGEGMQSYVSRRTEVSVSLPLFRWEGRVSSVWTVLPCEGLTVKGEVIYINCLICNLSSCEYGIWFTVEQYWLRQSFIQDLQDIFIDIILLVMCDLCSSPRGFYIIYLLLVPMIFVVQHLPVTCDPWCTTFYLLPIIV